MPVSVGALDALLLDEELLAALEDEDDLLLDDELAALDDDEDLLDEEELAVLEEDEDEEDVLLPEHLEATSSCMPLPAPA